MAQGEILAAYSKYFPETKGVEGVWRCETHGDWVLVRGERKEEEREGKTDREEREKREGENLLRQHVRKCSVTRRVKVYVTRS